MNIKCLPYVATSAEFPARGQGWNKDSLCSRWYLLLVRQRGSIMSRRALEEWLGRRRHVLSTFEARIRIVTALELQAGASTW